jgi:hypothetical protein
MLNSIKRWSSSIVVLALTAVPAIAGSNEGKPANDAANSSVAEGAPAAASPSLTPTAADANVTALLGVLVMKGVLAPAEANAIRNAAPENKFQLLVEALNRKGVLTAADLSPATNAPQPTPAAASAAQPAAATQPAPAAPVAASGPVSTSLASPEAAAAPQPGPAPQMAKETKPAAPAVIPAVAPVRVFPVDPPKTGGLLGLKVGPITLAPYGFIKSTAVNDTSDPNGDDFPFPGIFLTTTNPFSTGPTLAPAFHVKARSTRFGANFEWPDISTKLTLTGKIEADFEGNFSEVDNRDVSSIRSSAPQIRLAYVRMDYHAGEDTDIYFLGGQDWTLFGSGALPNILETTFLGAYWGDIYERSPQLRGGFIQTLNKEHNVKFEPEIGIMMPTSSQILKLGTAAGAPGLAGQLGEGEYEGAQSDRPEWEGRAALSFQLDPAKGVAPAQIALSGFWASRTSIVPNSSYITKGVCDIPANYCAAFPNGFTDSSHLYGGQVTLQLPTRWFTLVGSAYRGGDLRFYFGGQINSYVTDITGLTNIQGPFVTTDGTLAAAGTALLGTNSAGQVVVAPQKPVRSFGGFVNIGFPLSRWFNADPKGHNAGWQLYFDMGKDQVVNRDLNNPNFTGILAPLPMAMGKMAAVTLYYKVNPWCSFGFEQSVYATRGKDGSLLYTIKGVGSNEWQDHRTEFGPIFTF